MKIKELIIYGYGKFENRQLKLSNDSLQVIYGLNEAGKSTIMSFIHSILFGFPTKQQSERRYEPKHGGKYGGALFVENSNHEILKIERISGKSTGDVFVYNNKGQIGSEDELKQLLKGMDKSTFQSIFSFDLKGLQHVYELNREMLGKYLFLSSIFGTEAIYLLQDKLAKKQDDLYKPNGRKPILNSLLTELKTDRENLLNAKAFEDEYHELILEQKKLEQHLNEIRSEKSAIQVRLKQLEKAAAVLPLLQQKQNCLDELAKLPAPSEFPENGLFRLEQVVAKLHPIEGQLQTLTEKEKRLINDLKALHVHQDDVLQDWQNVHSLKDEFLLIRQYLTESETLKLELKQLQKKIDEDLLYLFGSTNEKEIEHIQTTMIMKEQLKQAVKQYTQLMNQKQWLDEQFERAKETLEESEQQLEKLKSLSIGKQKRLELEAEKSDLEAQLEKMKHRSDVIQQKEQLKSQMTKREKIVQKKKKAWKRVVFGASMLSMIGFIILIAFNQLFYAIVFLPLFILFLMLGPKEDELLHHLKEQYDQLENSLQFVNHGDVKRLEDKLEQIKIRLLKEEQILQKIEVEAMNVENKERSYDRIVSQYETWERDVHQLQEHLQPFYHILKTTDEVAPELLLERYERIVQCQKQIREKLQRREKLQHIKEKVRQFSEKLAPLLNRYQITSSHLEGKVLELNEKLEKAVSILTSLDHVKEELKEIQSIRTYVQQEIEKLLKSANVSTVEQFREKSVLIQKRKELEKQLLWIEGQVSSKGAISLKQIEEEFDLKTINTEESKLESALEEFSRKEEASQKRLAETKVRLQNIEDSGTYSELKYKFEMKRAETKKMAQKWAVYAVAKDLMQKTVDYHRANRMPKMLEKAEGYFRFLTGNQYTSIMLPEEKTSILAKRRDGVYFHAEELSQGTAEQLYAAIRFALVEQMSERIKLPIMIDDSFVNFDHERLERSIQLIRQLSKKYQVLLFTCHRHIVDAFHEQEIITLSEN